LPLGLFLGIPLLLIIVQVLTQKVFALPGRLYIGTCNGWSMSLWFYAAVLSLAKGGWSDDARVASASHHHRGFASAETSVLKAILWGVFRRVCMFCQCIKLGFLACQYGMVSFNGLKC
jgi:hypothetical protein